MRKIVGKLLVAGIATGCAMGQVPTEPPPIIQLIRKPGINGKGVRPYGDAKAAVNVIGMTAMTGEPETWMVESHNTFASIEDLDRGITSVTPPMRPAADPSDPLWDDVLAPPRTMILTYTPAWSYRADQAIRMFP